MRFSVGRVVEDPPRRGPPLLVRRHARRRHVRARALHQDARRLRPRLRRARLCGEPGRHGLLRARAAQRRARRRGHPPRRDDPGPAGFGPINPAWPQRAPKVGKEYGARWKKERFPYYAKDFDWTYFNAAPADQQLPRVPARRRDGRLPEPAPRPRRSSRPACPGLRIRAFVKDDKQRFREVPMRLDTLFADLDEGKLYLTWRGPRRDRDRRQEGHPVGPRRLREARRRAAARGALPRAARGVRGRPAGDQGSLAGRDARRSSRR